MVLGWFGELVGGLPFPNTGLGGKCVVWGSIRLAWVVFGFFFFLFFFFLSILSRSNFDHHLRCGGWLNFEFS